MKDTIKAHRNYLVSGLCSSSDILKTREHNVSETGCASVQRRGRETPTHVSPLERANVNHWTIHVGITIGT
jgi:hypothetical protein